MDNIILDSSVGTLTIKELFDFEKNLEIPLYQRPYSWEDEQVIDLIEDLISAFSSKKDKYLIGNMIFHHENDKLNIVDGQQRTTTLALILKVINESSYKLEFLNQKLNSLSYKSIVDNYKLIQSKFENYDEQKKIDFRRFICEKVIITYIKANTLDEAFMLFDSQNTRNALGCAKKGN